MDVILSNGEPPHNKGECRNNRHDCTSKSFFQGRCTRSKMAVFSFLGLLVLLVVIVVPCVAFQNQDETANNKGVTATNNKGVTATNNKGVTATNNKGVTATNNKGITATNNKGITATNNRGPLRIGAFNIKRFGKSLMKNDVVVSRLVKIFQEFDVMLVQEVRDSSHTALRDLNNRLSATGVTWNYTSSVPLGRSRYYKEQYVFFYKTLSVRYVGSHQVDDSAQDIYEREPFAVDLEYTSVSKNSKQRVVLMGLHAKPASAKEELEHLSTTIRSMAAIISPQAVGIITLGDFNADCSYLNKKERGSLDIFNGNDFDSLILDDVDTTVSENTDCAYDRVVVYGDKIDAREGSVFDFQTFLNLELDDAGDISDHYPVEFLLY